MKIHLLCLSIIWASSCSAQVIPIKTVKYVGIFPEGSKNPKRTYLMEIPTGGKLLKGGSLITGDYHTEYRITYSDSSIVYITNNEWQGSRLNYKNRYEIGINGYTKKHLLDTLNNEGKQFNGKYWREYILGDMVVGYVNVLPDKKEEFDKALATLRRKKK